MNFSTKIIFLTLLSISWGRAAAPVRLGAPLGWFSPTRFVPRRLKRPQRKRPNSQKRQRPPAEAACLSLLLRHLLLLLLVLVLALGRLRLPLLFDLLRVILPLPFEPRFLSCSFFSLAFSEKAEKSIFGCFLGASSSSESNSYGCPRMGASASTMPQVSSHDDPKRGCPSGGSDGLGGTQRTSSSSSSCSTSTPKRSSSRRVRSSRMMRSSASRHCRKSSRF